MKDYPTLHQPPGNASQVSQCIEMQGFLCHNPLQCRHCTGLPKSGFYSSMQCNAMQCNAMVNVCNSPMPACLCETIMKCSQCAMVQCTATLNASPGRSPPAGAGALQNGPMHQSSGAPMRHSSGAPMHQSCGAPMHQRQYC